MQSIYVQLGRAMRGLPIHFTFSFTFHKVVRLVPCLRISYSTILIRNWRDEDIDLFVMPMTVTCTYKAVVQESG